MITDRFQPNSASSRTPSATASSRVRNSRCQVTALPSTPADTWPHVLLCLPVLAWYLGRSPVRARMSSPSPITQSPLPSAKRAVPPSLQVQRRCR